MGSIKLSHTSVFSSQSLISIRKHIAFGIKHNKNLDYSNLNLFLHPIIGSFLIVLLSYWIVPDWTSILVAKSRISFCKFDVCIATAQNGSNSIEEYWIMLLSTNKNFHCDFLKLLIQVPTVSFGLNEILSLNLPNPKSSY